MANAAPKTGDYEAAETRLRESAETDLPVLAVLREATDALIWSLFQSEMPPHEDSRPVPPEHYVGTALLFLGVMGLRAARATTAVIAAGYESEAFGLKRLLTEIHSRTKAIIEDPSGQHARDWLVGPSPGTPRKLVTKHADQEMFDMYSASAHADAQGVKDWLVQRTGPRDSGISAAPKRRPQFATVILLECAREVRDLAVALASIRSLTPPGISHLDASIDSAEAVYLVPDASTTEQT